MNDRIWPDRGLEWSQQDLHSYVRQMGINPDPHEIIPQGVKYIAWPQPRLTDKEIARAQQIWREIQDGTRKSLNIRIPRRKDPRRN